MDRAALISLELSELQSTLETSLPHVKIVTCVPHLVRVHIERTEWTQLDVCLNFPPQYPSSPLLVELKSKTLSSKVTETLAKLAETEVASKWGGKPQCMQLIRFVDDFLASNPLVCCSDEIAKLKKTIDTDQGDHLKLSQKSSSINFRVNGSKGFFFKAKITIPPNYPKERIKIEGVECNFPRVFRAWFVEKSRDLARQCVQPPIKPKKNEPQFQPRPSLVPALAFLVENVKRYPDEVCQFCGQPCFPESASLSVCDENASAHVERVYCSHCFHRDCLIVYMKTPPFKDGKKCPACGQRIFHEKWKVTPELAEARWAHEQAKKRELGEVVDFLGDLATI